MLSKYKWESLLTMKLAGRRLSWKEEGLRNKLKSSLFPNLKAVSIWNLISVQNIGIV